MVSFIIESRYVGSGYNNVPNDI